MEPVFRVLGPLQVTGPKGGVTLSAARERTIMAQLVLNANKVVSVGRLVAAVWGYSEPSTARTQIQICISRLRRLLDGAGLCGRIVTVAPGYRLVANEDEIDLLIFEREASAALQVIRQRPLPGPELVSEGVAAARRALELFTAEPLVDVSSEVVQSIARQLSERRLHVLEECLRAQLDLGQEADAVHEIARLVAEHPLHARLRAMYMNALQRLGRRADALAAYREARREYREILGVEPDPELRNLYEAILHDMSHRSPVVYDDRQTHRGERETTPASHGILRRPTLRLPRQSPHLAARPEEFDDLRASLGVRPRSERMSDGPRIVSVYGAEGVGKTGFMVSAARELAAEFPDGQLFADLRAENGKPLDPSPVLARFLRALGVPDALLPSGRAERVALYRRLMNGRRALVVLDNATSHGQLDPLLPGNPECGVIVTGRHPVGAMPYVYRIRLAPFGAETAVGFLGELVGHKRLAAEPEHARTLARECAGLPVALSDLACLLNRHPHWSLAQCVVRVRGKATRLDRLARNRGEMPQPLKDDRGELSPQARRVLGRLDRAKDQRRCRPPTPGAEAGGQPPRASGNCTSSACCVAALPDLLDASWSA
ncbi:BTAD domain-containing putative transcriptional regulator [Streptomyces sp. NPDC001388]|uniref:AfsR/SARP family transcriptional regulator n=1 Tax=Streptomyces sp. NPDC001388 TaxID=3364568 RepID=UPI0036C00520